MKKLLTLLVSLFLTQGIVTAELPPEIKASASGGSRTLLEIQLNNLMQDMRPATREIGTLKEFSEHLPEVSKKLDNVQMPEKPKAFGELAKALEEMRSLKGDTALDPTTNSAVKNFTERYRALNGARPELPSDTFEAISARSEDPTISRIIDSIQRPNPRSGFDTPKLDELSKSIERFENGKFIPTSPSPTRQKVDGQIQAAIIEVTGLEKQFESLFKSLKMSNREAYNKLAAAVAAEITRREALLGQQVKSSEDLARQITDLEKAQTVNVGDLIKNLPTLIGILCALFVGLILLIRFYPPDLQTEWVASGQVIQLLTVVTLLLIILCLAVTHVIGENTVGTLLGGIGGYVLSQGIGRAAAREASRPKPPSS